MTIASLTAVCTAPAFDCRVSTGAAVARRTTGSAFATEATFDGVISQFRLKNRHRTTTVVIATALRRPAFAATAAVSTTSASIGRGVSAIPADATSPADSAAEVRIDHPSLSDRHVTHADPDRSPLSPTADAACTSKCSVWRTAAPLLSAQASASAMSSVATSNAAVLKHSRRYAQRSGIKKYSSTASVSALSTARAGSTKGAAISRTAIPSVAASTAVGRVLIEQRVCNRQR